MIHETSHWRVNHRVGTALPGYLMVAAKDLRTRGIPDLSPEALGEMGSVLSATVRVLEERCRPKHVYVGRFGHQSEHNLHFHVIPICGWVKDAYRADPRYRCLKQFYRDPNDDEPDGADLTLFVWREFCESPNPPPCSRPTVDQVIDELRKAFSQLSGNDGRNMT